MRCFLNYRWILFFIDIIITGGTMLSLFFFFAASFMIILKYLGKQKSPSVTCVMGFITFVFR